MNAPARCKAKVHLNLPMTAKAGRAVYSVQVGSDRVFYADSVIMTDCDFTVDARLRQKFVSKPSCRTVHAHVKGYIESLNNAHNIGGTRVRCNPFVYAGFVAELTQLRAVRAQRVVLHPDGAIEALHVVTDATLLVHANLTDAPQHE